MSKNRNSIIHMLATKYNLPLKKIEQMINYQFKFTKRIIKKGDFDSIRIPYFGKFSVKPNRIKHITKLKNESNR